MPVITLVSAKGSPGVTTTAAALAAVVASKGAHHSGSVLVELDPAGGDLEVLTGARAGAPSLLAAAAELRRAASPEVLASHADEVVTGLRALVAPTASAVVTPAIGAVAGRLERELAAATGWVVVDAGRWDRDQPTAGRLEGADVVGLVCRSTAVSVAHARDLVAPLRVLAPLVVVVLVGDVPYGPAEVATVLDAPVLDPVVWDPKGVASLWESGVTARWRSRSRLGRSAGALLDGLTELLDPSGIESDRLSGGVSEEVGG